MVLTGRVAIITGASRGIGKAIAIALAKAGAKVVILARSEQEPLGKFPGTLQQTVAEIKGKGGHGLAIRCDITDEVQVQEMVTQVLKAYGQIDILVNNAGVVTRAPFIETPIKHWDLLMRVNLRGTFLCTSAVLPTMIKQQRGSIVNLSSIRAEQPEINGIPYAVTKAGINILTRGLAEEVRSHDIAVNALDPGFVRTEGIVLTREANAWGTGLPIDWGDSVPPEDVCPAIMFLAEQTGHSFSGQVVKRSEFSKKWP